MERLVKILTVENTDAIIAPKLSSPSKRVEDVSADETQMKRWRR
jgi:hypothetical protein